MHAVTNIKPSVNIARMFFMLTVDEIPATFNCVRNPLVELCELQRLKRHYYKIKSPFLRVGGGRVVSSDVHDMNKHLSTRVMYARARACFSRTSYCH